MPSRQLVRASIASAVAVLALLLPARSIHAQVDSSTPSHAITGRHVYQAACSSCHGDRGTGGNPSVVGFAEPLPDLTDCSFAAREADLDWTAVVHAGGPARAFATMMPAFGEALTTDELTAALQHVRTFCTDPSFPRGDLNLPRGLFTEKAFPEDEALLMTSIATQEPMSVNSKIIYEQRLGARNQIEVVVPFSFRELGAADARDASGSDWLGGIGDLGFGFKRVVFASLDTSSILSAAGEIILPTGDRRRGFGKGATVLEPFLMLSQGLPADAFLHVQAGVELPTSTRRAEQEFFARVALGKTFTQGRWGRSWSPMIEILSGGEIDRRAPVEWAVVPQLQVSVNTRQNILASLGSRIPVDDLGLHSPQVLAYLLWDWFDGSLLEGW